METEIEFEVAKHNYITAYTNWKYTEEQSRLGNPLAVAFMEKYIRNRLRFRIDVSLL